MALQEKLDRFNKQQEKCQSMLSNIAAKSASSRATTTPKHAPVAASPFPTARTAAPVKFSNDTERLQHINSIRKGPVGAQMKRVIDILFQVLVTLFNLSFMRLLQIIRVLFLAFLNDLYCCKCPC